MSDTIRVLNRMYDVVVALAAAKKHKQLLNRIRLQKFIYLLDVVSFLYEYLPPKRGHLTYKNGPYDQAIQNAVDSLAFRGFVSVYNVEYAPDGKKYAEYSINNVGKSWLERLNRIEGLKVRWEAALDIGQKVNTIGWHRLVPLVYAEPTFVRKRSQGYGQQLEPNNGLENSAAFLIEMINRGLSFGFEKKQADRELIIELFFRYLDSYDRSYM